LPQLAKKQLGLLFFRLQAGSYGGPETRLPSWPSTIRPSIKLAVGQSVSYLSALMALGWSSAFPGGVSRRFVGGFGGAQADFGDVADHAEGLFRPVP
jgi:hypothetical protein